MTLRAASRATLALGALSIVAMLAATLALQDIYHGEGDLTLEWQVLRVASLAILGFHAMALTAAWKSVGFDDGSP